MCDYQGFDFGATYPDSVCIDGVLWDADSGESTEDGWEYDLGGEIPCPECNHDAWLESMHDDIEESGWVAAEEGMPRESTFKPETLRYPNDYETLKTWWLAGFDKRTAEGAA